MNIERVIVIDGRKDFPEPGQVMADVLVNEYRARCVVVFDGHRVKYVQRDFPIGWLPNVWWAVAQVMGKIDQGEEVTFPLDITGKVAQGPW